MVVVVMVAILEIAVLVVAVTDAVLNQITAAKYNDYRLSI